MGVRGESGRESDGVRRDRVRRGMSGRWIV